jgi:hypothetical protein
MHLALTGPTVRRKRHESAMSIVIRSNPLSGVTVLGVHPFTMEQVERFLIMPLFLENTVSCCIFHRL